MPVQEKPSETQENQPSLKKEPRMHSRAKERKKASETAYGEKTSLENLKPKQCHWPVGDPKDKDFGFCGAEKSGKLYCEKHTSIAYQKTRI